MSPTNPTHRDEPTASALLALADRAEKAPAAEQRQVLERAWDEIGPGSGDCRAAGCRFGRMLNCEAYESAAMMLVVGGKWSITADGDGSSWQAAVWPRIEDRYGFDWRTAATPALALAAACLRARATLAEQVQP